jgi:putative transposase
VERAQRERRLLVVGGASALSGVGAGGRVPRVLAAGPAGLRPGCRDRLGLAGGRRCDDQGAAGRPEDRPESHRQSEKGAKRSVLSEGAGVPIGLDHEGAQRNDHKLLKGTLESIPIERPAPTKQRPQGICLDGAYNNAGSLKLVGEYGLTPHIRTRRDEIELKASTPGWRARRWVVEACHSWLNRNRAILIRWSKKDENHLALLQLASGLIAFKKAHTARLALAQTG